MTLEVAQEVLDRFPTYINPQKTPGIQYRSHPIVSSSYYPQKATISKSTQQPTQQHASLHPLYLCRLRRPVCCLQVRRIQLWHGWYVSVLSRVDIFILTILEQANSVMQCEANGNLRLINTCSKGMSCQVISGRAVCA